MRRKALFHALNAILFVTSFYFVYAAHSQATLVRSWTDRTGQHRIEAKATAYQDGKVTLVRTDGKKVSVPLERLCDEDCNFVKAQFGVQQTAAPSKELNGITNIAQLKALANRYRTADSVTVAYETFLEQNALKPEERQQALQELQEWQALASQNAIRVGRRWLTPAELAEIQQEELRLIKEAHRLIDVKSDELARERFEEASAANEEAVRADFYLGLLHALVGGSPQYAEKHFRECVKRLEGSNDRLVGSLRSNYVAALNNLALAEVRLKRYDQALEHWETALEISPRTPELVQNIGRMTQLGALRLGVSKAAGRKSGDLYATACVANNSQEYDTKVAWLYMPFTDSLDGTMGTGEDEELRPVAYSTCFAVGPDLVLAPATAIGDASRFRVRSFEGDPIDGTYGELVGIDKDSQMVLIRFRSLGAAPLRLSPDEVRIAQDYQLIGAATPGIGNDSLNAVDTTVVAYESSPQWSGVLYTAARAITEVEGVQVETGVLLQSSHRISARRFALHNKVVDTGYVGAPLISPEGSVIAVHIGSPRPVVNAPANLSAALASSSFYGWLKQIEGVELRSDGPSEAANPLAGLGAANPGYQRSVYQLVGYKPAPRLKWSHRIETLHKAQKRGGWTSFEDRTCMVCSGRGQVGCTNRHCRNGSIRTYETKEYRGLDGSLGSTSKVVVPKPCPTCGGDDLVKCQHCNGSKNDPIFN